MTEDFRRATDPVISVRNLHKWFSGVHALRGVSLDFERNEAVGLVGDNGAGKTTLISVLAGVHQPDEGEIFVDGRPVRITRPREAMQLGIETIHQYNSLVPQMSIARNLFLGREPTRASIFGIGFLDIARMRTESTSALADVDLHLRSPDTPVEELSGGQRQGVAIARAMHFKTKVLILDEPTNHLSVKETNKVLAFVRSLAGQNVTGIFISHNMHHVFACCERVVAMAHGRVVFDRKISDTSIEEVHDVL